MNGPSTAPIYQFLKSNAGGFLGDLVKWNFEKFLVDKKGKVVERYPPTTSPFQIEVTVKRKLLPVRFGSVLIPGFVTKTNSFSSVLQKDIKKLLAA